VSAVSKRVLPTRAAMCKSASSSVLPTRISRLHSSISSRIGEREISTTD
jgi:hypothetical protein